MQEWKVGMKVRLSSGKSRGMGTGRVVVKKIGDPEEDLDFFEEEEEEEDLVGFGVGDGGSWVVSWRFSVSVPGVVSPSEELLL